MSDAGVRVLLGMALLSVVGMGITACVAEPTAAPIVTDHPEPADADAAPESGPSSSGSAEGEHYPEGASAETPECQSASAAAVAAVNAAMTIPDYDPEGEPPVISGLTASPDPANAVWLLGGVIGGSAYSDGFFVAWATTADPTQDDFDGELRAVGGATAGISAAPSIQFRDIPTPGGLPTAILRCGAEAGR
ncbi:hypothetical protein [Herbiconiux liukaitaii]|uniref:hypothetical protein n=1 Tax=Herbiconiux liukaitaii TaxID=3342799 RepID=UPI0035B99874